MDSTSARYRIQTVSELTGVPSATLRAWERRYGLPSPGRSSSAYRLYSDRDISLIRQMRELLGSGLAPNEAAKHVLANVVEPEPEALDLAVDPYRLAVSRIVEAAGRLDTSALGAEIRRVMLLDSGVTAFERVFRPALVEIGDQWHAGKVSIASEHFASHLICAATLDLLRMVFIPTDAPTILLACVEEEQHVLPLYGAALEVASWGYRPVIAGASTPPSAVARAREAIDPDVIGLSMTVAPKPASKARELVDAYADASLDVPFMVGGAAAHALGEWVRLRGGIVMPSDPDDRRRELDTLVESRSRFAKPPKKQASTKASRKRLTR